MTENSFMFYKNFIDAVPVQYQKDFCYALMRFAFFDELPKDEILKAFVQLVAPSIHKKAGAPFGNSNAKKHPENNPKTIEKQLNSIPETIENNPENNPFKTKTKTKTETKTETLNQNINLKDFIPPCIPPLKEGNEKTEDKPAEKSKRFVKPHIDEINAFCDENDIVIDTEAFYDYFESKGWTVGKSPMKDWRAAVRNWYRRQSPETTAKLEKENKPTSFDELYELTMKKLAAKQAAQKSEPITSQQKAELNKITGELFKSPDKGRPAANDDYKPANPFRGF